MNLIQIWMLIYFNIRLNHEEKWLNVIYINHRGEAELFT